MSSLKTITESQIRAFLNVSDDEYVKLKNPAPEHMHKPEEYSDMDLFVAYLHEEKARQEKDTQKILVLFGDYDTDGVCSSTIGSASLSVFGFRYKVDIPTMDEGYGLNEKAVSRLLKWAEEQGLALDMIVTADNGIAAHDGIAYAAKHGITVIVTDHHLAGSKLPQGAKVCVDPWKAGDKYPFKYNSGATVLWKAMLRYAEIYEPEKLPLIERLIVFAGLSNVADVMQLRDENRYMVVRAVEMLDKLRNTNTYKDIADTEYETYNAVFWGLHDLIELLQASKDNKRAEKKKQPVPLPDNEELISWYLSPMLNAPRRVNGSCMEAMTAFLIPDHSLRRSIINNLVLLNETKTKLRDKVLNALDPKNDSPVILVNTRHGISGLIAGKLSGDREMPSIVFSKRNDADDTIVYNDPPEEGLLTASARSNALCPLNEVIERVNRQYPNMISGGGHATAAGITIQANHYKKLKEILPGICEEIIARNKAAAVAVVENKVRIIYKNGNISVAFERLQEGVVVKYEEFLDPRLFAADIKETYQFLESLRPFGEGFEVDTKFEFVFDKSVMSMNWQPNFWKTFKFNICGVEFLTFYEEWANTVKKDLKAGKDVVAAAIIKMNTFRGKTTPQIQLLPL